MKRFLTFVLFILIYSNIYSQDVQNSTSNGDWIITADIGFATLEAKDNFKIATTIEGVFVGKEFLLNEKSSLIVGLGFENARADFYNASNQQVFIKNSYLNIPVSYRLFYDKPSRFALFADLGIYGSYLLKSKSEILLADFDESEKGLGFNFGVQGSFGAKYKFNNEKYNMSFGIKTKSDLINSYKSSVQEFMLKDTYMFQIGLGLSL